MKEFKIGDKIKLNNYFCGKVEGTEFLVVENCTNHGVWFDREYNQVAIDELNKYYNNKFSLVKENKQMFDMKKDKWFIRTPTPEISEAVQLWLFEQGFEWAGSEGKQSVQYTDSEAIGHGYGENGFGHTPVQWWKDNGHKEIKLTFKTSVASVEYPVVETEAEKELKALEQKIQELTEQASKLRSVIK